MMKNGIYINTKELESINNVIKSKRNDLSELFDRQKLLIERLHESWSGTVGDEIYEKLTNHEKNYDGYLNLYDKRTMFLSEVMESYIDQDKTASNIIVEKTNIKI